MALAKGCGILDRELEVQGLTGHMARQPIWMKVWQQLGFLGMNSSESTRGGKSDNCLAGVRGQRGIGAWMNKASTAGPQKMFIIWQQQRLTFNGFQVGQQWPGLQYNLIKT